MDPLAGSAWSEPGTVAGFSQSAPNPMLMQYAARRVTPGRRLRILDIGCGAGRNAVPLAAAGAVVLGIDLSQPMLAAAAACEAGGRLHVALASMEALPVRDRSVDLIIAHGIWNLARSDRQLRQAVREAARAAAPGAGLFVFTFSRRTVPGAAAPVPGESYVFTQFSGQPQVFLTEEQLGHELQDAGFAPDPDVPLRALNAPPPGQERMGGAPVILEAAFRQTGAMP
jgi:SAM-dependent methyltransferase